MKSRKLFAFHRADVIRRHAVTVLPHLTPRKIANVLLNEWEYRRAYTRLSSMPYFIKVDATPLCNLRCPGCPHGQNADFNKSLRGAMQLDLDGYRRFFDPLAPYLLKANLYLNGEPFFNRHIFDIIEHTSRSNVASVISSNFSMRFDDPSVERIITSGLTHLIVAVDGVDQATHETYRKGSSLETVLGNIRRLIAARERLGRRNPRVELQFVVFDFNRHQVPEVHRLAADLKVDTLTIRPDLAGKEADELLEGAVRRGKYKPCFWPWNTMVFRWDGVVHPCCTPAEYGDTKGADVREIWNNEIYQATRGLLAHKQLPGIKKGIPCFTCKFYQVTRKRGIVSHSEEPMVPQSEADEVAAG